MSQQYLSCMKSRVTERGDVNYHTGTRPRNERDTESKELRFTFISVMGVKFPNKIVTVPNSFVYLVTNCIFINHLLIYGLRRLRG